MTLCPLAQAPGQRLYDRSVKAKKTPAVRTSNSESRKEILGEFLPQPKNIEKGQEMNDIFVGM